MPRTRIDVTDSDYRRSHGLAPRGRGSWAVGVQLSSSPENGGQRRPHA